MDILDDVKKRKLLKLIIISLIIGAIFGICGCIGFDIVRTHIQFIDFDRIILDLSVSGIIIGVFILSLSFGIYIAMKTIEGKNGRKE